MTNMCKRLSLQISYCTQCTQWPPPRRGPNWWTTCDYILYTVYTMTHLPRVQEVVPIFTTKGRSTVHNVECTQSEKALSTSLGVSFNELYCEAFPCKKSPLKSGICTFKFELEQIQLLKIFFPRNMLQLLQYRMRDEQKSIKSKNYMFFLQMCPFFG